MPTLTRTGHGSILAGLAVFLTGAPAVRAQSTAAGPKWILTPGVTTFRVSDGNGWGTGPSLGAERRLGGRFRIGANAAVLLHSSGFYDFTGINLDVGPALALAQGRMDATLGVGASTVVGGDSDGTGGGWVGGYVAAQGIAWLGSRIGVSIRGALRVVTSGRTSPSLAAGIAVRLSRAPRDGSRSDYQVSRLLPALGPEPPLRRTLGLDRPSVRGVGKELAPVAAALGVRVDRAVRDACLPALRV